MSLPKRIYSWNGQRVRDQYLETDQLDTWEILQAATRNLIKVRVYFYTITSDLRSSSRLVNFYDNCDNHGRSGFNREQE